MKIVLADDHALVRAGFRRLLDDLPGVEVVGEAEHGLQVEPMVASLCPVLVILDVSMPNRNGLEVAEDLSRNYPGLPVLIVSMHANPAYVRRALDAGAMGFMIKDSAPVELDLALRALSAGQSYITPRLAVQMAGVQVSHSTAEKPPLESLTARQREVLRLIGEGQSTKQIASVLQLSAKTVETHRARIMEKLGLRSGVQLTHYAISHRDD